MGSDYIDQYLDGDLDLDTLGGIAAYSKFHFHRQFTATGAPPLRLTFCLRTATGHCHFRGQVEVEGRHIRRGGMPPPISVNGDPCLGLRRARSTPSSASMSRT